MVKKNYVDYVVGHFDPECVNPQKEKMFKPITLFNNFILDYINI